MQISKTCSEDACTGIAKAKGLCLRCYGRAYYEIQRLKKAAERASVCARTACQNVLYRFGLSGASEYCSTGCRNVARRRAGFSPSPVCCYEPCANLLDMGGWLLDPELGRKISYCSPKCQKREARRLGKLRTPARTCEIEGCEKRHAAKGLCKSQLERAQPRDQRSRTEHLERCGPRCLPPTPRPATRHENRLPGAP